MAYSRCPVLKVSAKNLNSKKYTKIYRCFLILSFTPSQNYKGNSATQRNLIKRAILRIPCKTI